MRRLISYLRYKYYTLYIYDFKQKFEGFVSSTPSWEALQTLGQSRALALTALVPFIGALIIFNSSLVDFLEISPRIVEGWLGKTPDTSVSDPKSFTLNRLEVTYFGLVSLGLASALFKLLCPAQVKKYPSVSDFIEGEKPLITNARRSILVHDIASYYVETHGEQSKLRIRLIREVAYPIKARALFYYTVEEITEGLEGDDPSEETNHEAPDSEPASDVAVDHDPWNIRVGPRSAVDSGRVAEILWAQRAIERGFWLSFYGASKDYLTDVLTIRYDTLIYSRPYFRIAITLLYFAGFTILIIPTIKTFTLIALQASGAR